MLTWTAFMTMWSLLFMAAFGVGDTTAAALKNRHMVRRVSRNG
jgi:hypothetical protein